MPKSFEFMVDDPISTSLCDYCEIKSCSSHPIHGCILCEGRYCENAYDRYVKQCEEDDDDE